MKHVAMSLLAALCGTLAASALDASKAEVWLSKSDATKIKVSTVGGGIASKGHEKDKTYARSWQYVSIPLHVEGKTATKGDTRKVHFIPELTVRISLAMEAEVEPGDNPSDKKAKPVLLSKEVTYVDIPLYEKSGKYEGEVNVGLFISPSSAFNLEHKEGKLEKKLIAVAVHGSYNERNCNRVDDKKDAEEALVIDPAAFKFHELKEKWWRGKSGDFGARVVSIAETPFANNYASMGFMATKPMYGIAVPAAPADAAPGAAPGGPAAGPIGGPVGGPTAGSVSAVGATSSSADAGSDATPADDEDSSKDSRRSKRDKEKNKKRNR